MSLTDIETPDAREKKRSLCLALSRRAPPLADVRPFLSVCGVAGAVSCRPYDGLAESPLVLLGVGALFCVVTCLSIFFVERQHDRR